MKSVAAQIFPRAQAGEPCRLFRSHRDGVADGEQKRDFVYVRDAVAVMLWLFDHPEVSGLYNVGTGRARSFRELAEALYRALGRAPALDYIDMPLELRDRYQYFTEAKMERLAAAGYDRPATPLEDGIGDYVRSYLATADPYR
jgi:ADP-L-glycero-D-manno-heptose 6-epimerase